MFSLEVKLLIEYIFIDVLFLENFIMNYITLYATGKYLSKDINYKKFIIGAAIGSLYSVFVMFPQMEFYQTIVVKFIISFVIVLIVFDFKTIFNCIKNLLVFYIVNIVIGGFIFAAFYMLGSTPYYNNGILYTNGISSRIFLLGIAFAYVGFKIINELIKKKRLENSYVNLTITFENKQAKLKGLIDTGNFLNDPISKTPVIVVELKALKGILPDDILKLYKNNGINFDEVVRALEQSSWVSRFRLIPFSALGTENGLIVGFKPDFVKLLDKSHDLLIKNVIVAVSSNNLSRDDNYQALLNPEILNT